MGVTQDDSEFKASRGLPIPNRMATISLIQLQTPGAGELTHLAFVSMQKNKKGEGTDVSSVYDLIQRLRVSASCSLGHSQVSVALSHTPKTYIHTYKNGINLKQDKKHQ